MSSNSFPALIRRSKLASYSPSIDQVYSSYGGHLSRSSFGLKRPLPKSSSSPKEPYIRVNELDTPQRRTRYRQATREAFFVKKWGQADLGIELIKDDMGAGRHRLAEIPAVEIQSRFVPSTVEKGSIPEVYVGTAERPTPSATKRAPNVLQMSESEFEKLLERLGERREAFLEFVKDEQMNDARSNSSDSVDLYGHAQKSSLELNHLVERFLAEEFPPSSSTPSIPLPHPYLSLQYSTPTPLELSFAPPIPGRLLSTPLKSASQNVTATALVLGQVDELKVEKMGGKSSTSFFPDAAGIRSNEPGRANFTVNPQIQPSIIAEAIALSSRPSTQRFRGATNSGSRFLTGLRPHEPSALASLSLEGALKMNLAVAPVTKTPPLPGSQEYVAMPEVVPRREALSMGDILLPFQRRTHSSKDRWNYENQRKELQDTRRARDPNDFAPLKEKKGMDSLNELFDLLGTR